MGGETETYTSNEPGGKLGGEQSLCENSGGHNTANGTHGGAPTQISSNVGHLYRATTPSR